ncbi:ABC transporter permease [Pigmentiphaga aceris]|uniref:ABC transporter permease n=1 Tax=Pigmentiphaga aceris TaxID=1940612 RepID=A0A5C0AUK1_9BURK|nr:ABC transporter permease [Pigmentiphaga aceris]QEI05835.1 ABC transporter permease [Pigmentiphaga aceris]
MTASSRQARVLACVVFLVLVCAWELVARRSGLSALVLPAPSAIAASLWTQLSNGYFWPHLRATLFTLVSGLALGSVVGLLMGIALAESSLLERVFRPYVIVSQVVPKLALAPLFVLWFGFGATSVVLITALICFFPLMENTLTALKQVDAQRLQLFQMLGATRMQTLLRLKLPTGMPGILAGLRVAVVLALVGAVVGEFIGASQGLGAVIIASQGMMDTSLMFAALILIAVIGLLFYQATLLLERVLLRSYTDRP